MRLIYNKFESCQVKKRTRNEFDMITSGQILKDFPITSVMLSGIQIHGNN